MNFSLTNIKSLHDHVRVLGEAWQPPMPTRSRPKTKLAALNSMMMINSSMMMQVSSALAKGNIRSARVKLRALYRRLDQALHEMERLEREQG